VERCQRRHGLAGTFVRERLSAGESAAPREDAMSGGSATIEAGAVTFAMQYRTQMADQGVCIHVMGSVGGEVKELLRFDCFDQAPHYHYAPLEKNERLFLDKTTAGNPLGWALKQLRTRLPEMLERAGYSEVASRLDMGLVAAKLDEAETAAREMARSQRRTVLHNRGDQVIEAGNIRFGLEFRETSNDRGMAIHVLTDVAGQELELLAFDCFENGPHYHYGPRNQDVRIYWDKTLVPDTLTWTLDQFKGGNLPAMIERAGYPTVASSMDRELVAARLEKEVAPAALAIRAANAK
jgi:hypothetical protein